MRLTRRTFIKGMLAIAGSAAIPSIAKKAARTLAARSGYVFVGVNGDDGNDGFSWSTRVKTLKEAIRLAQPGDTILVGLGEYRETITL